MGKKFFLIFGAVIIFIIFQKFVFPAYFSKKTEVSPQDQQSNTQESEITPALTPIIGIHYRMINQQTAIQENITEGAYVTQVIKWSPAEKAGIKEEDIITEIDGVSIAGSDPQTLYDLVSGKKLGEQISLKIWNNNEIKSVIITIE